MSVYYRKRFYEWQILTANALSAAAANNFIIQNDAMTTQVHTLQNANDVTIFPELINRSSIVSSNGVIHCDVKKCNFYVTNETIYKERSKRS